MTKLLTILFVLTSIIVVVHGCNSGRESNGENGGQFNGRRRQNDGEDGEETELGEAKRQRSRGKNYGQTIQESRRNRQNGQTGREQGFETVGDIQRQRGRGKNYEGRRDERNRERTGGQHY